MGRRTIDWSHALAALREPASRPADLNLTDDQIVDFLHQEPVTPEQHLQLADAQAAIGTALGSLTPREERVMRMHLGMLDDGRARTHGEMAAQFDISTTRAQQLHARALRKLLHPSRSRRLVEAAEAFGVGIPEARKRQLAGEPEPTDLLPRPARRRPSPPAPDERPARQTQDHLGNAIRLLRIPEDSRTDPVKVALAYHLEREFQARGAGHLNIHSAGLTRHQIEMRKYNYLMRYLPVLWEGFPPAPNLETA